MKKDLLFLFLIVPLFCLAQLSPCQQEQAEATGLIGEFIPDCEDDGSYTAMQCWASTGYCWCVDENGAEIPGTSLPSWQGFPECDSYLAIEHKQGSVDGKQPLKMIDVLGKEQPFHKQGQLLFYIYENRRVEKRYKTL